MSKVYKISELPVSQINRILRFNQIIDNKLKNVENQDFPTSYVINESTGLTRSATVGENRKSITIIEGNTQMTASFRKTEEEWFLNDEIIIRPIKEQGVQTQIKEKELNNRKNEEKDPAVSDTKKRNKRKDRDNGINLS